MFSPAVELMLHTGPLYLCQYYNNSRLKKYEEPLDSLNYVFSILSVVFIVIEYCISKKH